MRYSSSMPAPSRLTVVLCADAANYTAHAAADEETTHQALLEARELLAKVFGVHGGRIINTWGDGVIAEFDAVRDAVQAALSFQAENEARGGRLRFRIGINLADVVRDGRDLFGHGVNVAARLQQAAEPGGVMVSDAVHAAADRLALSFEPVATVARKPSDPPMRGWRIVSGDNAPPQRSGMAASAAPDADRAAVGEPHSLEEGRDALAALWARLTKAERAGIVSIGGLAAINLTTDASTLWFAYPGIVVTVVLALKRVLRA